MTRVLALLFLVCALAAAPGVRAQVGLPVPLPQTPGVGDVVGQVGDVGREVERSLQSVRRTQVRDLLRAHRRELEADPQGAPIVRSQILAFAMSASALAQAEAQGFQVVRTDAIEADAVMVTLRAPAGMSTRGALRRLRATDAHGVYDFDHLHFESGIALDVIGFSQSGAVSAGPRIGLIDSGVGDVRVVEARAFASDASIAGAAWQRRC